MLAEENFETVREQVLYAVETCSGDTTIKLMDLRKRLTCASENYISAGLGLLKAELSVVNPPGRNLSNRVRELEMEIEDLQILKFNEGQIETLLAEIQDEKEKLDLLESSKSAVDSDIRSLKSELPRTQNLEMRISEALQSISEEKNRFVAIREKSISLNEQLAHQSSRKAQYDTLIAQIRVLDIEAQKLADQIYLKNDHGLLELREIEKKLKDQIDQLEEFSLDDEIFDKPTNVSQITFNPE